MITPKVQPPLNVLLAVDGSEHAWAAVMLLRDLPIHEGRLPGSSVTVMGVLTPRNASEHAARQGVIDRARSVLQEAGLEAVTDLRVGQPAETLVEFADQTHPDLIMLGARGLRATLGILLGGVAQQVVEYAHWPVMVVRAPYEGLQRVLLVTDGSAYGQRAMEYLAHFPLPPTAESHLVHVLPPLFLPDLAVPTWPVGSEVIPPLPSREATDLASQQAEEEERIGQALLSQTREAFESILKRIDPARASERQLTSVLLRGDAATEIIAYAKAHQMNLIVAGSRGLGTLKGWLLGSVSRKLVHYADCSVLIVRGGRGESD